MIKRLPCGYKYCQYSFVLEYEKCKDCSLNLEKRELDEDWKPFVNELNERLKK